MPALFVRRSRESGNPVKQYLHQIASATSVGTTEFMEYRERFNRTFKESFGDYHEKLLMIYRLLDRKMTE